MFSFEQFRLLACAVSMTLSSIASDVAAATSPIWKRRVLSARRSMPVIGSPFKFGFRMALILRDTL